MTRNMFLIICICVLAGCGGSGRYLPDRSMSFGPPGLDSMVDPLDESGFPARDINPLTSKDRLSLDDLMQIAAAKNPEVRAAWSEMGAAAGRAWQAELYPNPELEIEAEDIPADDPGFDRSENSISLVQPIILGGRRSAAAAAIRSEQAALRLAVQHTLREIQADIRLEYYRMLYLKQAVSLYGELLAIARTTQESARARFDARAAPESEVLKARVHIHELELGQRRLQQRQTVSLEKLRVLLGNAPLAADQVDGELPTDLPSLDIGRLRRLLAEKHPALAAERHRAEAADWLVRQARAERIPDMNVKLSFGHNAALNEDSLGIGISLPLPLFDRNQGRILETRHTRTKIRQQVAALSDQLSFELTAAHTAYNTAQSEAVTFREQILPAAEKVLSQAEERYQAGKTTIIELLDAQQILIRTRLALLDALLDLNAAHAGLWKITGPDLDSQ